MRRAPIRLRLAVLPCLGAACAAPPHAADAVPPGVAFAQGVVFADDDGDGRRGRFEAGLAGVAVSNGREVVRSDESGRWKLPASDDAIFFVIKPRDWMTPVDEQGLPRFHYVHKPAGSPPGLRFAGVAPTGPLPDSIDFPLLRRPEGERFEILVFGDPQPYTREQLSFLERDVLANLDPGAALFGLSLGDLVGDDLALFEPLNASIAALGIPWYNVFGNHDMNFDVAEDRLSDESFERVYGPATYAFQVGRVHFVLLDDVIYPVENPDGESRRYRGGLTDEQLDFVRNYLAFVPKRDLVVLAMHIPLIGEAPHAVPEREQLFEMLAPFPHTLSLSAHTHMQQMHALGRESGWTGPEPHPHLNLGTTSGSWWLGAPDETGIPHATMRDGTPNGTWRLVFDEVRVDGRFQPARAPQGEALRIQAPSLVAAGATEAGELSVNLYAGGRDSRVEWRFAGEDESDWRALARSERPDPHYAATYERERALRPPQGFGLLPPPPSPHLWVAPLPNDLRPGLHAIEVRAIDFFGHEIRARHLLRVVEDDPPGEESGAVR